MKKMVIGSGGLVFLSIVALAIRLLIPRAVADAESGLSPFTAIPLNDGRNTGILNPGEAEWYSYVPAGYDDGFQRQADLTLFFTPDDGNRAHLVNFQIFPADQITRWYWNDMGQMQNLGAGGIVSRDGNPVTGELLWSGWLPNNDTYYIRVLNSADVPIDYWLFTDNIIAAELGPSSTPPPATSESVEANPDPPPTSPPTLEAPIRTDDEQLLPLASGLDSQRSAVEAGTWDVPSGIPTGLVIPSIALESKITPVGWEPVTIDGKTYRQWSTTDNLVSWHNLSAKLSQPGNTVLNGHSDANGAIFRDLPYVEIGDEITVFSANQDYHYIVTQKFLVKEKEVSLEERIENAKWVAATQDERLTLVTCANAGATHRLIVIARPMSQNQGSGDDSLLAE